MTDKTAETFAWAIQGSKLLNLPVENIMEFVVGSKQAPQPETQQEKLLNRGRITRLAAKYLRPNVQAEIINRRVMMPERRRIVLEAAKSLRTNSSVQIAEQVFALSRAPAKDRSDLVRSVSDDLEHHRKMGALPEPPHPPALNGPEFAFSQNIPKVPKT